MLEPHRCIQRFRGEKCAILSVCRSPITTSARPARIGSTRRGDVGAGILVVGVRVHDDVGSQAQRGFDAGHEGRREPAVLREAHDVVNAQLRGFLACAVGAPVVDDEHFDHVDAVDPAGQIRDGGPEVVTLVEARDLDDELHAGPEARKAPTLPRLP